jgi:hypothetical protein
MSISVESLERSKVVEIARTYEARGYQVIIDPGPEDLPEFLTRFSPDLLAYSPSESVVVEVRSRASLSVAPAVLEDLAGEIERHPGWRFEVVVVNLESDEILPSTLTPLMPSEILEQLDVLNDPVMLQHPAAAIVLAWSAVEAALRLRALREGLVIRQQNSLYPIKELAAHGIISREEYRILVQGLELRNTVAHGYKTDTIDREVIASLAAIARHLVREEG